MNNIFDFLYEVRKKPLMYMDDLRGLQNTIQGYYIATDMYRICENVPRMDNHFSIWLLANKGYSTSSGWGYAIDKEFKDKDERYDEFFKLVDEYRKINPIETAKVDLREANASSGTNTVIGKHSKREKPDEIAIVNYSPTHLHHFRYSYKDRIEDGWFRMLRDGSHNTSTLDLIQSAYEEYDIDHSAWQLLG